MFSVAHLQQLLSEDDPQQVAELMRRAYEVKTRWVGAVVYLRGLIELSNQCRKNCFYCGIRSDNRRVRRYTMSIAEICEAARFAEQAGYGSIVLQAGERTDDEFCAFIEACIVAVKLQSNNRLGITLSLGEQSVKTLRRWFNAGAHRYLLRIETSNATLYRRLHPRDHRFSSRVRCLRVLRSLGYQVGTGVMIGLPGQTYADLANDLIFFHRYDVDMLGMGPFIPHPDTPLAGSPVDIRKNYQVALKMIALARIYLKSVNIAASTALQAVHPQGREAGLQAGANVIMPNVTPQRYRQAYQLYEGKPCLDETARQCAGCLERRISSLNERIGYRQWGDAPHFRHRQNGAVSSVP